MLLLVIVIAIAMLTADFGKNYTHTLTQATKKCTQDIASKGSKTKLQPKRCFVVRQGSAVAAKALRVKLQGKQTHHGERTEMRT